MSGFELRPLSLGELLDRAFLLYRRNFWLFAGIMAVPSCVVVPMQFFLLRSRGVPFPWNTPSPQPRVQAYTFVLLFVYWIIYVVAQAATTHAVADAYLGRLSTISESYGKIRGRFWRMLGVAFGVGIRVFGLMLLLIILGGVAGGILAAVMTRGNAIPSTLAGLVIVAFVLGGLAIVLWLSMRYAVSLPAVLLEDINGRAAIRRSVQLSRGRRGQIFVAILLAIVVVYAMAFLFQGPFYAGIAVMGIKGQLPTWLILAMSVSSSIGGAIAGPLLMIILVLCYYDLRIRKEGFDLQHMMSSLPAPNPAVSTTLT
jgi:membrane-anchored glycerophosphoryl diester phosphodiesterase (GDPDase)